MYNHTKLDGKLFARFLNLAARMTGCHGPVVVLASTRTHSWPDYPAACHAHLQWVELGVGSLELPSSSPYLWRSFMITLFGAVVHEFTHIADDQKGKLFDPDDKPGRIIGEQRAQRMTGKALKWAKNQAPDGMFYKLMDKLNPVDKNTRPLSFVPHPSFFGVKPAPQGLAKRASETLEKRGAYNGIFTSRTFIYRTSRSMSVFREDWRKIEVDNRRKMESVFADWPRRAYVEQA